MAKEMAQTNYRRGIMPLAIMALLKRKDMYGLELVQEMSRVSGGSVYTQEGSMYPVLYKLLEAGYITDERRLVGKRLARIYYHLEPSGEKYLAELISEYRAVSSGVFSIIDWGEGKDE